MSLKMSNLLDIEKYLLLELVYFHLPPPYKQRISRETPMKLDEYIDLVDQCGYSIYPGFISRSTHGCQYKKRRQAHFKRIFASSDNLDDVVITGYPAEKNPYFNMVEARADGTVGLVRLAPDGQPVTSRQMAPPVWAMNASIYIWHRETLSRGLWSGRARLYEMPHNRSVDIDSEIDFRLVEMLMQEKQAKQ